MRYHAVSSLLRILSITSINSGAFSVVPSQTISQSIPKYPWPGHRSPPEASCVFRLTLAFCHYTMR